MIRFSIFVVLHMEVLSQCQATRLLLAHIGCWCCISFRKIGDANWWRRERHTTPHWAPLEASIESMINARVSFSKIASKLGNGLKENDIKNRWYVHLKKSSSITKPPVQTGFPSRLTWTADVDATIVRMRADDISFSKIALELGNGLSTNDISNRWNHFLKDKLQWMKMRTLLEVWILRGGLDFINDKVTAAGREYVVLFLCNTWVTNPPRADQGSSTREYNNRIGLCEPRVLDCECFLS